MRYNIVTNAETAFYRGGYRSLKCTISINYYNLSVTTGKNFSKTICFFFIHSHFDLTPNKIWLLKRQIRSGIFFEILIMQNKIGCAFAKYFS